MSNRTLRRMTAKRKYRAGASLNDTCSICLEDYSEGEEVRELPCKHGELCVCVCVCVCARVRVSVQCVHSWTWCLISCTIPTIPLAIFNRHVPGPSMCDDITNKWPTDGWGVVHETTWTLL